MFDQDDFDMIRTGLNEMTDGIHKLAGRDRDTNLTLTQAVHGIDQELTRTNDYLSRIARALEQIAGDE